MRPGRAAGWLGVTTAVVLLAELVAVLLDLWVGGMGAISTEERFNAQAAAHLACGHWEALWALRYRAFCGGCSAEAVAAVPLYRWLGPSVGAWKLVPASLYLCATLAGTLLARRLGGGRSGLAFAALVLGAPAAWRQLALTGFGNHAESLAFVFGAAALLAVGLQSEARLRRWPLLFLAGLVAGAGPAFAYIAAPGLGAVALLGLLAWRRGGLLVLPGALVGIGPLLLTTRVQPGALERAQVHWSGPQLAPPDELWRWLVGDFATGSLWPGFEAGGPTLAWWLLLVGLAAVGAARAWQRGGAGRWPVLVLAGLLLAYALRHDLWADNPAVLAYDPFNLRYRVPLLALSALAAALTADLPSRWSGRLATLGLAGLVLTGLGLRVRGWVDPQAGARIVDLSAGVVLPGDRPDLTVPEGAPPLRLARRLGRPQDLEAASRFLAGHQDRLEECRQDHLAELGRRAALSWAGGHSEEAARHLEEARTRGGEPALRVGLSRGEDQAGLPAGTVVQALGW